MNKFVVNVLSKLDFEFQDMLKQKGLDFNITSTNMAKTCYEINASISDLKDVNDWLEKKSTAFTLNEIRFIFHHDYSHDKSMNRYKKINRILDRP